MHSGRKKNVPDVCSLIVGLHALTALHLQLLSLESMELKVKSPTVCECLLDKTHVPITFQFPE